MPTLNDAARQLAISEKTLRKWMKRLEMKPARHDYDWRFYVLSDEQVQQIKDARAQMPGNAHPLSGLSGSVIPSAMAFPIPAAPRRSYSPRPAQVTQGALPDGLTSRSDAAAAHGVPMTTVRRWCEDGRIECDGGVYALDHGRFSIAQPITRRGMRQLYEMASQRPGFITCEQCPHDEA